MDTKRAVSAESAGESYAETSKRIALGSKGSVDLDFLRRQAVLELKRENIGVERRGYVFVVKPDAIDAFVGGFQAARPDLNYTTTVKQLGLLAEPKNGAYSIGRREIERIRADHARIQAEMAQYQDEVDELHDLESEPEIEIEIATRPIAYDKHGTPAVSIFDPTPQALSLFG